MGEATARRLAADGALVGVNDIDADRARAVSRDIDGPCFVFDVTNSAEMNAAVDEFVRVSGGLDIFINNAGVAPSGVSSKVDRMMRNAARRAEGRISEMEPMDHVIDLDDDSWGRMIAIHLSGTFFGCRAALRHMQASRSGRIVNVASVLGLSPSAGAPHYSAAKAGIIALTRAIADEVAPLGINVNVVCPGYIDTPLLEPFGDILRAAIVSRIGAGRMGTAAEVADLIRFLCGPESTYCTGGVYPVTGGYQS